MFGLKGAYFYLIALQITIIKFFKKIYFTSNYYNKSLQSKVPVQVYLTQIRFYYRSYLPTKKNYLK